MSFSPELTNHFHYNPFNGPQRFDVQIEKRGGGTVGRSYDGGWLYRVLGDDGEILGEGEFETITPKNHMEISIMVPEWVWARH